MMVYYMPNTVYYEVKLLSPSPLKRKKLAIREVKKLAQGHTAGKQQELNLSPGCQASKLSPYPPDTLFLK